MDYKQAKSNCFAYGTVPDGYNGKLACVGFTYDAESQKTLIVAKGGFYSAPIPPATDTREALWLLHQHPSANNIKVTQIPENGKCLLCGQESSDNFCDSVCEHYFYMD